MAEPQTGDPPRAHGQQRLDDVEPGPPRILPGVEERHQPAAPVGFAQDDGFTGKGASGVGRWGDYSAATSAEDGSLWFATEFIPNAPRNASANWGTFVTRVAAKPEDTD